VESLLEDDRDAEQEIIDFENKELEYRPNVVEVIDMETYIPTSEATMRSVRFFYNKDGKFVEGSFVENKEDIESVNCDKCAKPIFQISFTGQYPGLQSMKPICVNCYNSLEK